MRLFRLSIATVITYALFSPTTLAAGFQIYELGAPIVGTAEVGQAALAQDASIAYYNPAAMVGLQNSQFLLGSQVLVPYMNFRRNNNTTISGDNGGNAGALTPGMGIYYVHSFTPCLKFGVSLTTPYGGSLNYNDGWVGRYNVQYALFYVFNLNPSVGFRVNDWLDLGVGVAAEYINLQQTTALPIIPEVDGQVNVKVDNVSAGYNFGALITPTPTTKIGIAYRSQIVHNMHGDLTFLRIAAQPNTTTSMTTPQNVILSLTQDINCYFTLLGEAGWANWASMKSTILHIRNFAAVTPLDWKNTYRVGLGGQYHYSPAFTFQAGVSYDSSPTDAAHRLPVLPMDRQVRVGAGVLYHLLQPVTLGLSYEYINFGKSTINNNMMPNNNVLSGSYSRNYGNFLQVSLNVVT